MTVSSPSRRWSAWDNRGNSPARDAATPPAKWAQPRLLILTAGFGEGHNAAARAILEATETEYGPGSARLVDAFAVASPRLNKIARKAYLALINRAPRIWSTFYDHLDRTPAGAHLFRLLRAETRVVRQCVAEFQPTAICSTYPVYGYIGALLAADFVALPPFYTIITDSITINSLWWRAPAAGWFLPNLDSTRVLSAAGVPEEKLHTSGFPVAAYFGRHASEYFPPALAAGAPPRVLYIINSGHARAVATARALFAQADWDVTCAVGRDATLRSRLESIAAGRRRPVNFFGWTDQIPRLLLTHHVVISKAGGATTQEAIAAGCPLITNQIVPGQEEGNYELLRRHDVGAFADGPEALVVALQQAFNNGGNLWSEWRKRLQPLSRPGAAAAIVGQIVAETTAIKRGSSTSGSQPNPAAPHFA